jgi:hypothetical protein
MSAAKVASGSLFKRSAFLVPDDHDFTAAKLGKACEHCAVIPEELITMQFDEFIEG